MDSGEFKSTNFGGLSYFEILGRETINWFGGRGGGVSSREGPGTFWPISDKKFNFLFPLTFQKDF